MVDTDKGNTNTPHKHSLLRDPAAPSGAVVVDDIDAKLPKAKTGSTHFSALINEEWFVVNARGEKMLQTPFKTEQEAADKAAEKNGQERPDLANHT